MKSSSTNPIRIAMLAVFMLFSSVGFADLRQVTNQYGMQVLSNSQARFNYSREQLPGNTFVAIEAAPSSIAAQSSKTVAPDWQYAAFGNGIGLSNIIVDNSLGVSEIYLGGGTTTFGSNNYWYILRSGNLGYQQVYVSRYFSEGIKRIAVGNVTGGSGNEIVVALSSGQLILVDQTTHEEIAILNTAANALNGMSLTDLDGDGFSDIVVVTSSNLYVYGGDGALKWQVPGVGGTDVVIGQMDADPEMEIATTDGHVVDAGTQSMQWYWPGTFGYNLGLADIDGDGLDELIAANSWYSISAYDVDIGFQKWSLPTSHDIGAICLADVDGDGVKELIVGEGQWGSLLVYDTTTLSLKWSIANPEHGVTHIAVADVDHDGGLDLLWGAGATSTGSDHLYVAGVTRRAIKWENIHLDGPFVGPEYGDLDGDGKPELVVASFGSDSGYSSGRILVFDGRTYLLRAISDPIVGNLSWTGIKDIKLRDMDGDGRQEILIAADYLYDGVIEAYNFSTTNQFNLVWTNTVRPYGAPFYSVDAVDTDGDGQMEIIGGGGREHTGASGVYVYEYDWASGAEKWHSAQIGDYWDSISGMSVADVDGDGIAEIAALESVYGDVYLFDAFSKVSETILLGDYQSLSLMTYGSGAALGLAHGNILSIMQGSSVGYTQVFARKFGPGTIDGATQLSNGRYAIGNGGTLGLYASTGKEFWESAAYGTVFGKRVNAVSTTALLTTGSYSVARFKIK